MIDDNVLDKVEYLIGESERICQMQKVPAFVPFEDKVCSFLFDLSEGLMKNSETRMFSDITTFAFWIRKASIKKMQKKFIEDISGKYLGKGLLFHIAPSNVPMNFAYSMTAGLLMGNANIVRVPSKDFRQTEIVCQEIESALIKHTEIKPYICLVKYGHEKDINDYFSSICDERIVWGGDRTINELRQSPLPPRSQEIAFADRYSFSVIDSDYYVAMEDKHRVAIDFFNDTYLTDQNACTSPKLIIWMGEQIEAAKNAFWKELFKIIEGKYQFSPIQAVDKLDVICRASADIGNLILEHGFDNRLVRVKINELTGEILDYACHSGFFYEYDCSDIMDSRELCDNKQCQTISYLGSSEMMKPLIESGVKGIDRIVPIGKTMDFDLIWDGYDLRRHFTRIVSVG